MKIFGWMIAGLMFCGPDISLAAGGGEVIVRVAPGDRRTAEAWPIDRAGERFTVLESSGDRAVLRGPREALPELESRGWAVREVISPPPAPKNSAPAAPPGALYFTSSWGPGEFPGETITQIEIVGLDSGEQIIFAGTRNSDWSAGGLYAYDHRGSLLWNAVFPLGVTRFFNSFEGNIAVVSRNEADTRGGVAVLARDGTPLGNWTSQSAGIASVYYYYDLDYDGGYELVIEPKAGNEFSVLSPAGEWQWSGTVTERILNLQFEDLSGTGKTEIIVFSGDRAVPRGEITIFDPATGNPRSSRLYGPEDLAPGRCPEWAEYADLDGDGKPEIIPDPWYLNRRLEILAGDCSLLYSDDLGREVWSINTFHDFNYDGRRDIVLRTENRPPDDIRWHGYLDFTGNDFGVAWTYPTAGPIARTSSPWAMDDDIIAFGTSDNTAFSAGRLYLLNTADGTEFVPPVPVPGSVAALEYSDLNGDEVMEVAVLIRSFGDSEHLWTLYVYNQNLELLSPSGHLSYPASGGSLWNWFASVDLSGDGTRELVPQVDLGAVARVADYTGGARWTYPAPGTIAEINCWEDIDGDGRADIAVVSGGPGGELALLGDRNGGSRLIGRKSFPDQISGAVYPDFNRDGRREAMLTFADNSSSIFTYNLSRLCWAFTPPETGFTQWRFGDLDGDGLEDIVAVVNDPGTDTGRIEIFFAGVHPALHTVDSGDYNGDGTTDIAVFRGASGLWAIRGITRAYFGGPSDLPVSGDYTGNGTADIAVFRGASGLWAIRGVTRLYFGGSNDLPVPRDYAGNGKTQPAIFRPSSGLWAIRGATRVYFGAPADTPIPGYYGPGGAVPAVFRPASGLWAVRGITRTHFGGEGDLPAPGDYGTAGVWETAFYRPAHGHWAVRGVTQTYYGGEADRPLPGGFGGPRGDRVGIFRNSSGLWAIENLTRVYFGKNGDIPATR